MLYALVALVVLAARGLASTSARVVKQIERGVVFRLGRAQPELRRPGLTMLIPVVDRMKRVNVQVVTMPVPAQDGITRDNVTVRVDAVVYFKVIDPLRAVVEVQDYEFAISQVAQTSLRSIIGKSELDDLLSNREQLNQGLEVMLDSPAASWGIEIDRVEIKDVALPESMKRSMSRQAEAERERRSRIITADGEFQASQRLSEAAAAMAAHRPRCSCGCCRRWSRWRPRRTRPSCCRSRSRCCATSRPSRRVRRPRPATTPRPAQRSQAFPISRVLEPREEARPQPPYGTVMISRLCPLGSSAGRRHASPADSPQDVGRGDRQRTVLKFAETVSSGVRPAVRERLGPATVLPHVVGRARRAPSAAGRRAGSRAPRTAPRAS